MKEEGEEEARKSEEGSGKREAGETKAKAEREAREEGI